MRNGSADHPANAGLRRYLEPRMRAGVLPVISPDEVERPYETLGTHPDLVARLWDELGKALPEDCRGVFFGAPGSFDPAVRNRVSPSAGASTYAVCQLFLRASPMARRWMPVVARDAISRRRIRGSDRRRRGVGVRLVVLDGRRLVPRGVRLDRRMKVSHEQRAACISLG